LPERVAQLLRGGVADRFGAFLTAETLLVATTIAVPTLAMGGVFPLVAALVRRSVRSSGRAVGLAYAANSLGNIAGSFIAGFVLVPALGMRGTIVLSALLTGTVALGYLGPALRAGRRAAAVAAAALAAALAVTAWAAPEWNRQLVTSGPYFHAQDVGTLIDYREGASTVVAVKQVGNVRIMQVGGIREATSGSSLPNFLGHLAMLLHGPARDVLVVGLGSGTTLASVLAHPVEHVDCVEISPEVVAAARAHFSDPLGKPLADPRVRMVVGDGRNHLRHCGTRYDVIVSQPSYPWVSGAGGLFTREYFDDVRDHLAPGGVAVAWFTAESEDGKRSVIRAWIDAFPAAYLFESKNVDSVLIGLRDPAPLSAANVAAGVRIAAVQRDLAQLGITDAAALLGALVAGPEALRRYAAGVPSNTDENGWVEFRGLRDLTNDAAAPRSAVPREDPARYVDPSLASAEDTAAFARRLAAEYASKR
jgi:spermidine synthase